MVVRIENRSFSQLHVVIYRERVVSALRQREAADALVLNTSAVVVVTNDQRVAGVDGVIEARAEKRIAPRHDERLAKIHRIQILSSTVARTRSLSSVSMRPKLKKNDAFFATIGPLRFMSYWRI